MSKDKTADPEQTLMMPISMGKNKVPDCPRLYMHDFLRSPMSHTLLVQFTLIFIGLYLSSLEEERIRIAFS